MPQLLRAAPCAVVVASILVGCQHIPAAPLDLNQTLEAFQGAVIEPEPVASYVERFSQSTTPGAGNLDLGDGISMLEGQAIALWYNPDLRAARMEVEGAAAVAGVSGRWNDPTIELSGGQKEVDSEASLPFAAGGVDRSWIDAASLSITIPLSGRPRAEKRLAASEVDVAEARAREAEWLLLEEVRRAWIDWGVAVESRKLLEEHALLVEDFARAATALAQAGELYPTTARLFEIERERVRSGEAFQRAEAAGREMVAKQLLGLLPNAPLQLQCEPAISSSIGSALANEGVNEIHPAMARLKLEYQASEAALVLEQRKQYPDLTVSPLREREENESSLQVGLGFPLPVWNANREGIAEAVARRDSARAALESAVLKQQADRAIGRHSLDAATQRRASLATVVAPLVDQQIKETGELLRAGEIDIIPMLESLRQALEFRQQYLEAVANEQRAASRMMTIFGIDPFSETIAEPTP